MSSDINARFCAYCRHFAVIDSNRNFERCIGTMGFLGMYEYKILNKENITPEESFENSYIEEVFQFKNVHTSNELLRTLLDDKY